MGQAQSQSSGSDCGDCSDSGNEDGHYGYGKFCALFNCLHKIIEIDVGPDPLTSSPGRLTNLKPGSKAEDVDAFGRPIVLGGAGSGSGSGYPGYTTGSAGGGNLPIGTRPGSFGQTNGASGPSGPGSGCHPSCRPRRGPMRCPS